MFDPFILLWCLIFVNDVFLWKKKKKHCLSIPWWLWIFDQVGEGIWTLRAECSEEKPGMPTESNIAT